MKLSLSWIFDHIDGSWNSLDIQQLVAKIIETTAEIEDFYPSSFDASPYTVARIIKQTPSQIMMESPEWGNQWALPYRSDMQEGHWYMVTKDRWASMKDFGGTKEHLLPAIQITAQAGAASWKQLLESHDYILEIDNKSINHRPDLWGHRGFAREIAAILSLPLKPISQFITQLPCVDYQQQTGPIALFNKAPAACNYFTALYIPDSEHVASPLTMMQRLCRVDSRPIDARVDTTNYVMFDLGQPMHVFDARRIEGGVIGPRFARDKEQLMLLDGTTITLTSYDTVISDGKQSLGLAGIMGGKQSGVQPSTSALLIEAACFDATSIRLSAQRHKLRTESSARFEKSLDPHQTILAIERLVTLYKEYGVITETAAAIMLCGTLPPSPIITITHTFLEQRIGVTISPDTVRRILNNLGFVVTQSADGVYTVTVPSWRATKDVSIKEDIVEEVGRFIGYSSLEKKVPCIATVPGDLHQVMRVRLLKNMLANSLLAKELYTYAFFDEEFLQKIAWAPEETLSVKSPVSEHYRRLVTTLVPNLLKAVYTNAAEYDSLRFFEWGRTWPGRRSPEFIEGSKGPVNKDATAEYKKLSLILFEKKQDIDFYQAKELTNRIFESIGCAVHWRRVDKPTDAWYKPFQTADILYQDRVIGRAGKVNPLFLHQLTEGDAFIVELDGDFLQTYTKELQYKPISKYPEVVRDISALIPLSHTVDDIVQTIKSAENRITQVQLIDFFTKPEWLDQRSLTFRYIIQDEHKTLTKDEVDIIMDLVSVRIKSLGATIR